MTLLQETPIKIRSFRAGGVGWQGVELVEYQKIYFNIPKIMLKLLSNTKIKKTTVYFVPKILYPILSIKVPYSWNYIPQLYTTLAGLDFFPFAF